MNKSQRMVVGIGLILMGVYSFVSTTQSHMHVALVRYPFAFYSLIILGIAFIGSGIFVLISKKRR